MMASKSRRQRLLERYETQSDDSSSVVSAGAFGSRRVAAATRMTTTSPASRHGITWMTSSSAKPSPQSKDDDSKESEKEAFEEDKEEKEEEETVVAELAKMEKEGQSGLDARPNPDIELDVEERAAKSRERALMSAMVQAEQRKKAMLAKHSKHSLTKEEEDDHIQSLERTGALKSVIGPHSMLSQELEGLSQRTVESEGAQEPSQQGEFSSSQLSVLMEVASQELDAHQEQLEEDEEWRSSKYDELYDLIPHVRKPARLRLAAKKKRKARAAELARPKNDPTQPSPPSAAQYQRKKRKTEREAQQREQRKLAQQAASLAAQAISSPEISKQLLLKMVFCRTNPRSPPATWPPRGSVIPDGFFWASYPPLDKCLKSYMREYYELSVKKCQSKEQQKFNNDMVIVVRREAAVYEWTFDERFTDKLLRDRIRCYFKTHIQNAKKRLRTMLMNPTKKANTRALIQHLDLIQEYSKKKEKEAEKTSRKGEASDDDDDDDTESSQEHA